MGRWGQGMYLMGDGKGVKDVAKSEYAGKIKNSGTQVVEALHKHKKPDGGKVITGNDLRANAGKKK